MSHVFSFVLQPFRSPLFSRSLARAVYRLLFCCSVFFSSVLQANVQDVRMWKSPDNTRVVFDLSKSAQYKVFTLANPNRVVLDIEQSSFNKKTSEIEITSPLIKSIRAATKKYKKQSLIRVVLDLNEKAKVKSFLLKPNKKHKSYRLVVDLYPEKNSLVASASKPKIKKATSSNTVTTVANSKKRDIIIAIDAGHGGEDPGAVGYKRTKEKKVVLSIAKELARLLKATPGFTPYLVRTGDYYVGLRDRTRKARNADADLFVSIHADAFRSPKAYGSSVFVLSGRGASSEEARYLAQKENEADLVGGVSLDDKDDYVAMTLLDLSMTSTRSASIEVGSDVLKHMGKISRLHKKRVGEAAFVVLKAPDIPAILIETGFISNPGEAKKLATSYYRKKMAKAIYSGLTQYFKRNPVESVELNQTATVTKNKAKTYSYTVKSGDNLSLIAFKNQTSVTAIKRLNKLSKNGLRIGQKLKLPEP